MGLVTVELDHESLLAPQRVDLDTGDRRVDLRGREAGLLAEDEEALLEDAPGSGECGQMVCEGVPDGPPARLTRAAERS
jgi:hypothetical protein